MKSLDGHKCPTCGGPLTYEAIHYLPDGEPSPETPSAADLAICVRCVVLVLCKATVAIHGDVGDQPGSNNFPGHEERMRAHEQRVAGPGLADGVAGPDEELVKAVA